MSNRRNFLKTISLASLISLGTKSKNSVTPAQIEGPFYPTYEQKDKDFDLTIQKGSTKKAKGDEIFIEGRVMDLNGKAIEDATVDLWQANAQGRYRHPHDDNKAPLDPNFQGWSIIPSGKEGFFRFKTIMPGAYPIGRRAERPPHIHFKVSKKGFKELITQMYFPNNPLNKKDLLLNRLSKEEQKMLIAKEQSDKIFTFNIYLQKL